MIAPAGSCAVCGRFPAQAFAVRRHVGMLVVQQFVKVRETLCRDHALQLTKAFTLKTLWQGWWGYISFFANLFVLAANFVVAWRAIGMDKPRHLAPPPPVSSFQAVGIDQYYSGARLEP